MGVTYPNVVFKLSTGKFAFFFLFVIRIACNVLNSNPNSPDLTWLKMLA